MHACADTHDTPVRLARVDEGGTGAGGTFRTCQDVGGAARGLGAAVGGTTDGSSGAGRGAQEDNERDGCGRGDRQ